MRTDRILRVAEAIEKGELEDVGFNMGTWEEEVGEDDYRIDTSGRGCGTVACIAGWASKLERAGYLFYSAELAEYFDISLADARTLAYAHGASKKDNEITPSDAAKVLRHLAETGEVDWGIIWEGEEATT